MTLEIVEDGQQGDGLDEIDIPLDGGDEDEEVLEDDEDNSTPDYPAPEFFDEDNEECRDAVTQAYDLLVQVS